MKETLKLALEALEAASRIMDATAQQRQDDAITAIKAALAQPAQELWAGVDFDIKTTPPQRPWVGLTDAEAQWLYDNCRTPSNLIDMVETMLKDKNI